MTVITKKDGKEIEKDCDFFADENTPISFIKENCFTETGLPKCPLIEECFSIYTRRKES